MWDKVKQIRLNTWRAAARQCALTEVEGTALRTLTQESDASEVAYLYPATERVRQEREALGEQKNKFGRNTTRTAGLYAEVRALVTDLEARERWWRQRYRAEVGGGQGRSIVMTATERAALRQGYNSRSGYCGVSETDVGAALTTDHLQPTSRGGTRGARRNVWPYLNALCPSSRAARKSSVRSGWRPAS